MKKCLTFLVLLLWSATLHAFTITNGKIYDNNKQIAKKLNKKTNVLIFKKRK